MTDNLRTMFNTIAARYDITNDILSLGRCNQWRKFLISFGKVSTGESVLDACCGTGALSTLLAASVGASGKVVGLDFSANMIEIARKKHLVRLRASQKLDNCSGISFEVGDALDTKFVLESFDVVTIAFGIRNLNCLDTFFMEVRRVLSKNGRLLILELGQPRSSVLRFFYKGYQHLFFPAVGCLLTGNASAYSYLLQTTATFPCGMKLCDLMSQYFRSVRSESLFGGIAYVYSAHI